MHTKRPENVGSASYTQLWKLNSQTWRRRLNIPGFSSVIFSSFLQWQYWSVLCLFFNRFITQSELGKTQQQFTDIGFPGCRGYVYCMKNKWKNFHSTTKEQYINSRDSKPQLYNTNGGVVTTVTVDIGFPVDLEPIMTWMFYYNQQYSKEYSLNYFV